MNTSHTFWFCVALGVIFWLAKGSRNQFEDGWTGNIKHIGVVLTIFLVIFGGIGFFNDSPVSGEGQINAFTGQDSAKNYRLDAEMVSNPNKDMLQFFKQSQYEITSVTWPNGGQVDTDCVVREGSREECEIGDQNYYVEVAGFQSDESDSSD